MRRINRAETRWQRPAKTELAPIESRDELVTYIEQGEKPKADWRIGTEHEKFPFYREGLRPVPYEGPAGIRALLEGMAEKSGWRPIYDLEQCHRARRPDLRARRLDHA